MKPRLEPVSWRDRLRTVSIPAVSFGGIGLVMLLIAGFWAIDSARFAASAVQVPGMVIRNVIEKPTTSQLSRRSQRSSGPMYAPVVRFRGPHGKDVEFTGLGAGEPDYKEGSAVTVIHPPGHPERARIGSHQELWLGPIVVAAFGALFAAVGLLAAKLKF
jgi:hypothetical protein